MCEASLPYPYLGTKILLFQLYSSFMSDSEVPAKNKFSSPSGVNVGVNEVVPEISGHAREGRNQNTQELLGQALGSAGFETKEGLMTNGKRHHGSVSPKSWNSAITNIMVESAGSGF